MFDDDDGDDEMTINDNDDDDNDDDNDDDDDDHHHHLCDGQLLTFVRGDVIQMSMRPLPPGALRTRIEYLTDSVGFPLNRIYVYEGTVLYDYDRPSD